MVAFRLVGHTATSYVCHSPQIVHFGTEEGGYIYKADWRITDIHLQAFNVWNNTFSQGRCTAPDRHGTFLV